MSSSKNLEYEKTSFLNKSNNKFIENMYVRFIENDPSLPDSWNKYFSNLNDDMESVAKEIKGPTWNPKKIEINTNQNPLHNKNISSLGDIEIEKQKNDTIKAIALIRAYRIRGHLIANLDPLGLMERKYLHELDP